MDNILTIFTGNLKTPEQTILQIARQEKALRKKRKLSRSDLSKISNVSYGSLKRFEESGHISLASLVKLAVALDCTEEFSLLFHEKKVESIEDIINEEDQID